MSNCEEQLAVGSGQLAVKSGLRRVAYCLLLTANCLLLFGCRQDMQDQPRYEVYESSPFFKDGLSSRPLVEGTVPRGYLKADKEFFTGQYDKARPNQIVLAQPAAPGVAGSSAQGNSNSNTQGGLPTSTSSATVSPEQQPAGDANDVEAFPFPVTDQVMERGRERYQIFCAMCHGYTGDGDGMIVRRGFRPPPSYHENRLRQARVGYLFKVITEGFGAMPSHRGQVPAQDRWAIIAYVRALQLSKMDQQQAAPSTAPAGESGGHK